MCAAIVNGLLMKGVCECDNIRVYDINPEKTLMFKKIGVYKTDSIREAAEFADYLFLSVRPQNFDEVLDVLKGFDFTNKTIVTIAAGISMGHICDYLGQSVSVIRVMPNTPMTLGLGAIGICKNESVSDETLNEVIGFFSPLGVVGKFDDEEKLNSIISLTGSSPAYIYLVIKTMIDWGVEHGFSEKDAKELVCAAVSGSAELLRTSELSPEELISGVCSHGGTTIVAVDHLRSMNFDKALSEAMDKCYDRAKELSK